MFAVVTHMFQNGTCAILVKLSAIINIVEMFCDGRSLRTEKVSYLLLSEPDSFFLGIHLYFEPDTLIGLVEHYLLNPWSKLICVHLKFVGVFRSV